VTGAEMNCGKQLWGFFAFPSGCCQGCLCVHLSVSSVRPSVMSDKVHVRPISKYSSIFEHILENIHRICPLRPIPNRQNRPSVRLSRPSTTSLPPNTSDKTTLVVASEVCVRDMRGSRVRWEVRGTCQVRGASELSEVLSVSVLSG
jgi:hypothetical protein